MYEKHFYCCFKYIKFMFKFMGMKIIKQIINY